MRKFKLANIIMILGVFAGLGLVAAFAADLSSPMPGDNNGAPTGTAENPITTSTNPDGSEKISNVSGGDQGPVTFGGAPRFGDGNRGGVVDQKKDALKKGPQDNSAISSAEPQQGSGSTSKNSNSDVSGLLKISPAVPSFS